MPERAGGLEQHACFKQASWHPAERKEHTKEGNERARVDPGCIAMISSKWQIELVSREDSGWAVAAAVAKGSKLYALSAVIRVASALEPHVSEMCGGAQEDTCICNSGWWQADGSWLTPDAGAQAATPAGCLPHPGARAGRQGAGWGCRWACTASRWCCARYGGGLEHQSRGSAACSAEVWDDVSLCRGAMMMAEWWAWHGLAHHSAWQKLWPVCSGGGRLAGRRASRRRGTCHRQGALPHSGPIGDPWHALIPVVPFLGVGRVEPGVGACGQRKAAVFPRLVVLLRGCRGRGEQRGGHNALGSAGAHKGQLREAGGAQCLLEHDGRSRSD